MTHKFPLSLLAATLGAATLLLTACGGQQPEPIDRHALLKRNSPVVTRFDSLASLTVGNGGFAFTVDATGLQTFPEAYSHGVPLGTMSDWGWHAFANDEGYRFDETLVTCDFGRGHTEVYASQTSRAQEAEAKAQGGAALRAFQRRKGAIDYVRQNVHRLHLGTVGLALGDTTTTAAFTDLSQRLDLETGTITSRYRLAGEPVEVVTACDPNVDLIGVTVSAPSPKAIVIRMPYPTGGHSDDACRWTDDPALHTTRIASHEGGHLVIDHDFPPTAVIDELGRWSEADFSYRLTLDTDDAAIEVTQAGPNAIVVTPSQGTFAFTVEWDTKSHNAYSGEGGRSEAMAAYDVAGRPDRVAEAARDYWHAFWHEGGIVDFSHCTAPEARELERRVVLSQYLLAVNCAGNTPPQETGLTYNSWFGKYHMEMIWWHQAQFALYGHADLLLRTLRWYADAEPVAREIARRQGFRGVRWMKMTDPSGLEAPSSTGSFLIWQQPHLIYLAELARRAALARGDQAQAEAIEAQYYDLVQATAEFMADFAVYDTLPNRYILKGAIPAQETLKASTTLNPPFELSQWHFALGIAGQWRERREGMRNMEWDELRDKLSPLHYITDSVYSTRYGDLYTASEDTDDTYRDVRLTSDHMAVLGALGIFPKSPLVREDVMRNTLHWVWDNWNWGKTWGWDYPMTAMCAARLGERQRAVDILLEGKRTNTYLTSGHNYQDSRLRLYLPGNGGLLTAVAMMCAGWDGCDAGRNPGFPDDGRWDVRWEGLLPLP